MRREDKEFDPFAETPVDGVIAAQCAVQVTFRPISSLKILIYRRIMVVMEGKGKFICHFG